MVLDEPKDKDVVKEINDIRVSFDDAAFEYAKNLTLNNEDGAFFFEKAGDNGCSSCSSCG